MVRSKGWGIYIAEQLEKLIDSPLVRPIPKAHDRYDKMDRLGLGAILWYCSEVIKVFFFS